ncbi:hypothetical protein CH293_27300 [Rhodococcus sp. 14-2470-1b]|nr:hypothetical protein CH293_27300 [Rhodococcus sp. 14-2470-1b]
MTSIVRRVLVVSVVVVVTVCALFCQRLPATFAAAGTPMEMGSTATEVGSTATKMGSTAAALARTPVVDTGVSVVTSEAHESVDCGEIAGGFACVDAVAVVALSAVSALTLGVRTGAELDELAGRYPTRGLQVSHGSDWPPWTVLSLAQLSVSRV